MREAPSGLCAKFSLLCKPNTIATVTLLEKQKVTMQQNKQQHQNMLDHFRRRMGFSPAHVAHLLGHQDASALSDYERGEHSPSLANALRLGIILRVPVEFLFPTLYDGLRNEIRAEEERLAAPQQATLF